MSALPFRHVPFGIPDKALQAELRRRRRARAEQLAPRRAELADLRARAADLKRYLGLLQTEVVVLEDEERMLLRTLAELTGKPWEAPPEPPAPDDSPLGVQRRTLQHYRALQRQITASVLALIAPFLASDPSPYDREPPKEERTWPSNLADSRSSYGEP